MAREEKQILLKDLCARLPYGVIIDIKYNKEHGSSDRLRICSEGRLTLNTDLVGLYIEEEIYLKPYLRPMSSMTETERLELSRLTDDKFKFYLYTSKPEIICYEKYNYLEGLKVLDFLNAHHFDYRGLISKGLALPAPEGMYDN